MRGRDHRKGHKEREGFGGISRRRFRRESSMVSGPRVKSAANAAFSGVGVQVLRHLIDEGKESTSRKRMKVRRVHHIYSAVKTETADGFARRERRRLNAWLETRKPGLKARPRKANEYELGTVCPEFHRNSHRNATAPMTLGNYVTGLRCPPSAFSAEGPLSIAPTDSPGGTRPYHRARRSGAIPR